MSGQAMRRAHGSLADGLSGQCACRRMRFLRRTEAVSFRLQSRLWEEEPGQFGMRFVAGRWCLAVMEGKVVTRPPGPAHPSLRRQRPGWRSEYRSARSVHLMDRSWTFHPHQRCGQMPPPDRAGLLSRPRFFPRAMLLSEGAALAGRQARYRRNRQVVFLARGRRWLARGSRRHPPAHPPMLKRPLPYRPAAWKQARRQYRVRRRRGQRPPSQPVIRAISMSALRSSAVRSLDISLLFSLITGWFELRRRHRHPIAPRARTRARG